MEYAPTQKHDLIQNQIAILFLSELGLDSSWDSFRQGIRSTIERNVPVADP